MKKVRCGVIGAGWWATTAHLPALRAHPDVELVAVQSLDENRIHQIAKDFRASQAFTDLKELLAIDGLDAVVIASTPNMHYEQTHAALHRGLHVLVEKPMTFTAQQAAALVKCAAGKKLHLLTG